MKTSDFRCWHLADTQVWASNVRFRAKSDVAVPGEAGRSSLEAVLAILEANRSGRTISLPLSEDPVAQPKDSA